jgi:2-oxoisovalerate ferredoxin oxidoreductase beta subunit
MRMAELLAQLEAPVYIERCHLDESSHVLKTRSAIRKAIQAQIDGKGFAMVEAVSPCPTGWGLDPLAARQWITDEMARVFPAHVCCDRRKDRPAKPNPRFVADAARVKEVLGLGSTERLPEQSDARDTHRLVVAGFGGQGVLSLGMMIARTGMMQGRRVSWLPSYGPEMRGGTANCSVVLSDSRIGSPVVSTPTVLVAFNEPSLEKFGPLVEPGGLVIYDDSFVSKRWDRKDVRVVRVSFSSMANELGTSKVANMVAFGAINQLLGLFPPELVHGQIHSLGKRNLIETNLNAFEAGTTAVRAGVKEGVL